MFKKSWIDAKKVVSRGNMLMLAIGMLIGAAFGAVVKSLANDVIMQAIAKGLGIKGVENMAYGATKFDAKGVPLDGVMYGKFLSALLAFAIVVFFILIGLMIVYLIINYRKRNDPAPAPAGPSLDQQMLEELKKLNAFNSTFEQKFLEEKAKVKKVTKKTSAKTTTKKPVKK